MRKQLDSRFSTDYGARHPVLSLNYIERVVRHSELPTVAYLGVIAYLGICQHHLYFEEIKLCREWLFTGLLIVAIEVRPFQ